MKWETVKLGDIADFSNGLNFDKSAYSDGIKLIGVSNFGTRFSPDYSELSEVSAEIVREADLLQNGDIVFVRSNGNKELVGRCMLITKAVDPVTYSGFVIRCRIHDQDKYDPVFFTYHFKSKAFRQAMAGTAVGANIQNLSQGRLSSYSAFISDTDSQHHIAEILSSYDDLIENNQKQIKLLEEAAQRLYKEWFIDLRFPGHESTPIHDGIPDGWEKTTVENAAAVLRRGISPSYDENGDSTVINQKCIRQTIVDLGEARKQTKKYPDELNLQDGDTVICSTGDGTLGRVGQIFGELENTTLDSHVTIVRATSGIGAQLLFWAVKSQQAFLQGMGKGSTNQLELSRSVIQNLPFILPDSKTRMAFEALAQAIHDKIATQNKQIIALQTARDRLLPKLMSGEIEV